MEFSNKILKTVVMSQGEYIKKLEKRIHNQRLALRDYMEWTEGGCSKYRKTPLRTMWFDKCIRQGKEIKRLEALVNE